MKKIFVYTVFFVLTFLSYEFAYAEEQKRFVALSVGSSEAVKLEDRGTAFRVSLGYNATQNIGFELGYLSLGSFNNGSANVDVDGFVIDLLGYLPISEKFSILGRVGMFSWAAELSGLEDDGTDLKYGVGVKYDLDNRFALRAEYENYNEVSGSDISLISAGFTYSF